MAEYHVKNGSHVDKAFKVGGGHQVVPAGKEADVVNAKELTEAQLDAFEREGVKVKAKGGKAKKEEDTGDTKSAAEVLAMADGNFMAFKSAAFKLLGDATPTKKDEIIAALEELATKPE
ncbi:hypothetical protein [Aquamicrobium soli]|uniref:Uncharacterized protein n=1 Tax=Aquamicrobium soli TaxID=1811518 RepID=A0ABV7KCS8_9HYPH